jgi:hypothetical protein
LKMERHGGIHFHFLDNCVRSNDHSRVLYHSTCERAHPKIETTLTKQTSVSYPGNLLLVDTVKQKSQLMLAKFEEKNYK